MVPLLQETVEGNKVDMKKENIEKPLKGDEVVISGMSGIFPKSNSVFEFMENLYNEVDMVTDEDPRWIFNHPEVPNHLGKVNGMEKFDAQFFRVHYKQACTMEPMSRKLLEHTYSAIFDSGINPLQLRGKKVGVFIGSSFSESEKNAMYENVQRNGLGITGCNKAMYANRISYWIDGKGPSYALDLACASSMVCLEHAYRSISTGECDAAIVGGCNLCMHPNVSLNLRRAGFLCLDGKTKCFDKNGDGYVRSDAINVLFLQRAKDAKRIYSQVYHALGNFSLKEDAEFLPIRESKDIQEFLEDFYSGIDVSPDQVEFVEANGSGIAEADGNELEAIGKVFGKGKPVQVGSVKSNMGHSEPASGVCSITKACLAYHKGQIPANLHYYEPQMDVPSVRDQQVVIPLEKVHFNRGFTALNSFSYSGANIHVLLKGHYKAKDVNRYKSSIPRLVLVSGRQESCVNTILNTLKQQKVDPEQIGLLHSIHENEIPGHMCRGYTILDINDKSETLCLTQKEEYFTATPRPVWFVYSGMGSQWATMGTELMKITTFAAAIQRCHNVLEPKGVNILEILTKPDKTIYDHILHSFVGIAAVQIGLTDVLKELGIVPDKIIGHSVGELGCAYADGCLTAEEMILAAYSRGLVSVQTPFVRGSMAAVGLGYKTVLPLCPPEIEVACHNSSESSTISGPSDVMKKFVSELTSQGIFAKEVPCSNIAYHSRYIADAGPGLLKLLREVIKNPKERSEKWVSTSVPQEQWDKPKAKFSSAEYHTNNLLNSVLFEETAKLIPAEALCIEIAPHGLLQAILKRSHSECVHVPLTRRGHSNPVQFFLEAIGKLYQEGLNPKVKYLYPKIEFPVSTETPLLSHLVEWEHSEDWPQVKYDTKYRVTATARDFIVSIHDEDYNYLDGYIREGVLLFSEAAMLVLVWETLAMQRSVDYRDLSVVFNNIQFSGEANVKAEIPLKLAIMVLKGNHRFEVSHNGVEIVSGNVEVIKPSDADGFRPLQENKSDGFEETILTSDDVYKILRLKGFSYKNELKAIQTCNVDRNKASVKCTDEWAMFLDSLLQFNTFARDHNGLSVPKFIRKLTINIDIHKKANTVVDNGVNCYIAEINELFGITRCAGVEIENITFDDKPVVEKEPDLIQNASFIPHFMTGEIDIEDAMLINLQIINDNIPKKHILVTEMSSLSTYSLVNAIKKVSRKIHSTNFEVNCLKENAIFADKLWKSNVFLVENLLGDEKKMKKMHNILNKNTYVLTFEEKTERVHKNYKYFNVITTMNVQKKILILLNKANEIQNENITYLPVKQDEKFAWIPRVQYELQKSNRVVLVSEREIYCGLLGLVKKLAGEHPNKIGVVIIDDFLAPAFNPEHKYFKDQLEKNLNINVLKKGQWGGYYYLSCPKFFNTWNVQLTCMVPGDINSLSWIAAPNNPACNTKVQVCYAGPSFKDTENAVGKIKTEEKSFGMDFSGINNKGERVMGIISGGAISSTVQADPDLLWPVPEHWSLEDAATVPLPYIHAYYCMTKTFAFPKNSNVFVNSGAGALGQAIISVCLYFGWNVFTTVSNIHKKLFLLRLFPQLPADNICCSRHDSLFAHVTNNTNGEKCSYVINTLSGSLRLAAMKCVSARGVFLDVSDTDAMLNKDFGMSFICQERHYKAVNLARLFDPDNDDERKKLQILISEGIAKGAVRPLSRIVYSPNDVSRAFRLLASSNNRGRALIRMREPNMLNQVLSVKPAINYSPKQTHIIISHGNGLGIELADHLVKKGAKKLLFHFKESKASGYFWANVASWRKQDVAISISSQNLQTVKGCNYFFAEGLKLGTIQGIFIVLDSTKASFEQDNVVRKFNESRLVANLDLVSRNVCAELKYFAVIANGFPSAIDAYSISIAENVCRVRNEIGLPALVLHVGLLKEVDENLDVSETNLRPQSLPTLFSALETSLKLKYNNVKTFDLNVQIKDEYLDKISRILGFQSIDKIPQDMPLKDLAKTDVNLDEIKTVLKEAHQTNYPREYLEQLTIHKINSFGTEKLQKTKFDSRLGAFYTFIDEDECMATEPLVAMPTKVSNATETEEELDPKATYLMMVPGFEGHHQIFKPICERLKVPAIVYQLGPDVLEYNIPQMAAYVMKFMKKRFELNSKFYLLGYSFGVNVALELAALMEKEGHVGIVYCLDSSPDALRAHLDAYVGNVSETELENPIIEHMHYLMTGKHSNELKQELSKLESWKDKVEACVNKLRGLVNYSLQYKRSIIDSAYKRIKLAREYKPSVQLKSEIVLLKGIAHPKAINLPNDYNLSKYTQNPVKIYDLETDHATAPSDCRISNVINSLLEPTILTDFKKKNLCETYLVDTFKIL